MMCGGVSIQEGRYNKSVHQILSSKMLISVEYLQTEQSHHLH